MKNKFPNFLNLPVEKAAQQLLGCVLERELEGNIVRVRIVETEAYSQEDPASHAFGGQRARNATMFGSSGHLYVYFTYGMHYCANIVTGHAGYGSGCLIRAAEPIIGHELLEQRRGVRGTSVTNGPAKLCQALGIDLSLNGHDLRHQPLKLLAGSLRADEKIATSPRIGISKAQAVHRRYFIANNPFVSKFIKPKLKPTEEYNAQN